MTHAKSCDTCQAKGETVERGVTQMVCCHLMPDVEVVDLGYWCMQHIPVPDAAAEDEMQDEAQDRVDIKEVRKILQDPNEEWLDFREWLKKAGIDGAIAELTANQKGGDRSG